ncbi:hypothetical protein [Cellulomonas denverensis]|uniref:HTH cro/C1-type domain-containing protein n=1 Tax=Cellulomonas denverensis TaxID=264297 RepID=A0A7X6KUS1_9CELL|nr:hypothetical protein [Cellulomonas denverensis]NKY22175.1 hypothetical protein [Cellulomonas denverensis]GIG27138.1 hypothetical protein Cde04nite_33820 [Cellulomonas denverensis]
MTNSNPQTLREVAQLASDRNGGARGRELGRIAEKQGLTLSYTTVDRILTGKYLSRPGHKTLEALAALSGVPLEDVYRAAGVPVPLAPLAEQLPDGADTLSPEQRMVVLGAIRQFAELNRALAEARQKAGEGDAEQPAPKTSEPSGSAPDNVRRLPARPPAPAAENEELLQAGRTSKGNPPANAPDESTGEESQDDGGSEPR